MKRLSMGLLTLSLALVLAAGCSRESNKGGPTGDVKKGTTGTTGTGTGHTGTTGTAPTTGTGTGTASNERDDFTVKVPTGNTNVTQGERTEMTVTVSRHGKFDQDVHLKFDPPAGVKVEPATVDVPKGKDDARVTVSADNTAKVGTTNIMVTGTGGGGPAAKVEMGIEVKAASKNK